jgi:deoxyribodipyrimidine photo-lyase
MTFLFPATTTKDELRTYLERFDVIAYAKTRNHLSGTVSRLSPFITRGVITLPEIRHIVLQRYSTKDAEKFIQELAWREYWQQVWFAKQNDIFRDLRFPRTDWSHEELVEAIVRGKTEVTVIDEAIHSLYESGYMHNHARMWVAMLACNVGKAHWYDMSRWLYYHLLDGDLASNTLSWQWIAGTNAGKRYVANQSVINSCSDIKQVRSYLTLQREEVGEGPVPEILKTTTPFPYTTTYPESDDYDKTTAIALLYSPWTLNPDWRSNTIAERILLIEPRWFDLFPVSPAVLEFICSVARTQIPGIKIVVSDANQLDFSKETEIYSQAYPMHQDWLGVVDAVPRLFPHVVGYYPSFFKFWEACQKG